jgi:2-polyprenyl-6-methoxyphenol hydroxylase-like FAD-dependent oxidoreductase
MIAAAILAKSGYRVDTYEIREKYTRNIQWAGRQSLVDELASIDFALEKKFLENVSDLLYKGSIHLKIDGTKKSSRRKNLRPGDPRNIPLDATEMMKEQSIINMEAKVFEQILTEYIDTLPNVHRHIGSIDIKPCKDQSSFCINENYKPDIIIIAEGANSKSREILGIKSFPTSPIRLQIAGNIDIDGEGVMIKHWRRENGNILLTGIMGKKGAGKTWLVADADTIKINPNISFKKKKNFSINDSINQRLIISEFKRLIAGAMELPINIIAHTKIEGAIENTPILFFGLQQKISEKAYAGNNVILLGDAVGHNHWSVGGGMQVGVVCHAENLKKLLFDIDMGRSKDQALENYSNNVLNDTQVWGEMGIVDFYPSLNPYFVKRSYNQSIEEWRTNKIGTPRDVLNRLLQHNQ